MCHLSFKTVGTLALRMMLLLCLELMIRWWSHLLRCLWWGKPRWGYIATTWAMRRVKLLWIALWNEHTLKCLRRLVYGFNLLLISLQLYILLLQWRSTSLRNVIKRVLLLKWRSISLGNVIERLLMRIVGVLIVLLITVWVELRILLDHDWLRLYNHMWSCWHLELLLLIYVIRLLLSSLR